MKKIEKDISERADSEIGNQKEFIHMKVWNRLVNNVRSVLLILVTPVS